MVLMYWVLFAAALAVLAAGWVFLMPFLRDGKSAPPRKADRVKESSTTMGCGTAFGRLSTIR